MRRLAALPVLLALLAPGCLTLLPADDGPLHVAGPTRGYSPTASYLKVHVEAGEGHRVLVDFDRRDWHVSELARRLDEGRLRFLVAEGPSRLLGEVVAETVHDPGDLGSLRYASMGVSEEERLRLDAEYDALLARLAGPPPLPPGPAAPQAGPLAAS